jgi:hypothetical protein
MSFTLTIRQGPARLASRMPQLAKLTAKSEIVPAIRSFQTSANSKAGGFFTPRTASLAFRSSAKSSSNGLVSFMTGARRGYQYQSQTYAQPATQGSMLQKLLVGGAIFGGTLVAINIVFNRETREDGGMPAYERSYLNNTFLHTGLGIGIIGLTARQMIQTGFVYRIMVTNPWVMAIGGLALSFGTMIGTRSIDPDK